jgi:Tol biopolymer transport system component/DNA-binding winged helix-turn-helix (wHTH) protein
MKEPTTPPRPIRFGVFEVDLRSGELRKQGLKIKLQDQPFEVLAMLLEHPGELVTREELQKRLWPKDTFVDFEHSLNTSVKKLREALGDDADNPRFIETLHRRGYRFIYPVDVGAGLVPAPGHPPGAPLRRWWIIALAGLLVIAGAIRAYLWLTRPLPPPKVTNAVQIARLRGGMWVGKLLTDGTRVYFTDWLGDSTPIMQVSVSGGEAVPVPTPFRFAFTLDISPDRSVLLVRGGDNNAGEMPVWVLPVPGGLPRRLGDIVASDAAWSPDGQKIVYAKGDLYLAKSDGTESRKLATVAGAPEWLCWSPDGSVVRFTQFDPIAGYRVWEVSADGSSLHQLVLGWSSPSRIEQFPTWTPNGKYFMFSGMPETTLNSRYDLWASREKVGLLSKPHLDPIQLTQGPIHYFAPLTSPDGKKLFAIGRAFRGELVRYEVKAHQFVPFLSGISASDLDFSRDGQWVTYIQFPDATLWRSKMDGSERLQLNPPPLGAIMPRWSPDGKRIVFMGTDPDQPWDIYLVSADGGAPRRLLPGERQHSDPQWSPDGNQLLFGRGPYDPPGPEVLRLLDLRTNQVSTAPGSEGLRSPRWSYDGRYVVAMKDGDRKLVFFDFATHRQVELASAAGGFSHPNWSRDGKWIYLWADFGKGRNGIHRVRLTDRKVELLVGEKEVTRAFGTSGQWVGLAPDDSLLVTRDISLTEIYAFDWEAP